MKYIFLHGLGQTAESWEKTVRVAELGADVLCPDLSAWLFACEPTYAKLYEAFEAYCGRFEEPLCLCGLSLGGVLALHYAIGHGARVSGLVLMGTPVSMPRAMLKLQNIAFRLMPEAAFRGAGFDKRGMISLCSSMTELDFRRELSRVGCRTLIMCGEKDRANRAASLELKRGIPRAKLSVISGAGHEVNVDNPAEVGEKLKRFFRETHAAAVIAAGREV